MSLVTTADIHPPRCSTRQVWAGGALSGLAVLFLAFDAAMKLGASVCRDLQTNESPGGTVMRRSWR
jgi:hypothetical protein